MDEIGARLTTSSDQQGLYLTVEELLALPAMAGARLLTEPQGKGSRRVLGTSVQEVPLDDFVRSGELVMTTGIGLGDDEAAFLRFVREIAAVRAAALAVAKGPYVAQVPAAVVKEAERAGLAVLEFPWRLRFSAVTELVLAGILGRQHEWLRRSEEVHHLLTRIVLRGGDLKGLCRFVEERLGRPIRVTGRWGETADGGADSLAAQAPNGWESTAVRVPITADRQSLGVLLIASGPAPLSKLHDQIAAHAATAAALIMFKEQTAADDEVKAQTEFVTAIANAATMSPTEVERRALVFGVDPDQPFAVYHVSFWSTQSVTEDDLAGVGRWAVQRAVDSRRRKALQAWDGTDSTLVIPIGKPSSYDQARLLVDDITSFLQRRCVHANMSGGIGRMAPNLFSVRESVREAVTANRLGVILNGPGSWTSYGDLGPYPALYEALNCDGSRSAFAELHERYLDAACRYEAEVGLPLLMTLVTYFAERGNVSATARTLRINRQSLLYRLEKFELVSAVDLSSPVDRFALELAVRCWQINRGEQLVGSRRP